MIHTLTGLVVLLKIFRGGMYDLADLGFIQPPVRVLEDNKGVCDLSYGTTTGKSGHFRRFVFYFEGLVNRGICWFDKVASEDNQADIFTKCLDAVTFHRLVDIAIGTTPTVIMTKKLRDILRDGYNR